VTSEKGENSHNDEVTSENNNKENNKNDEIMSKNNEVNFENNINDQNEVNENIQNQYKLNNIETYDFRITIKKFDKIEVDYKYLRYIRRKCKIK